MQHRQPKVLLSKPQTGDAPLHLRIIVDTSSSLAICLIVIALSLTVPSRLGLTISSLSIGLYLLNVYVCPSWC